MSKFLKVLLTILLLVIIATVAVGFFASGTVEKKLKEALANSFEVAIENTSINLWKTTATFSNVKLLSHNRAKDSISVSSKAVHINFSSLYNVLTADTIKLEEVKVEAPNLQMYAADSLSKNAKKSSKGLPKAFQLAFFEVTNGSVAMYNSADSLQVSSKNFQVLLSQIQINETTLSHTIPFDFTIEQLRFSELYKTAGKTEELLVKDLVIKDSIIEVSDLYLKPLYNKKEYIKHIEYQDDWMDLHAAAITIHSYNFDFESDQPKIAIQHIEADSVALELFRDKSIPRDFSFKPLYSKMLRDLPIDLKVDSVQISNTQLLYEERLPKHEIGKIDFKDMQVLITDINNVDREKKTQILIDCKFLNSAPLHVEWIFDIHHPQDYFEIKGSLGTVAVEGLNNFMDPMMNVQLRGTLDAVLFNFYGTNEQAKGEFTMKFHDLKVDILKKADRKKKRKLLSAVTNLFVHKKQEEFETHTISVKRTKYKSFFNYFWLCIEDGVKKTIVF